MSGPVPVEADTRDVADWLAERYGPVTDVRQIGAGAWSRAFGFRVGPGTELVARVGAHVDDFRADACASDLARPGLPVPRTLLVESGLGAWVSVTTRCHGTFLEELDGAAWRRTWPSVEGTLRSLWGIDVGTLGTDARARFGVGRRWADFLLAVDGDPEGGRSDGARAALAAHEAAEDTFVRGVALLRQLVATPALATVDHAPCLVHCDLLNRNAMVHDDRVTGVFDWGCAFVGDPLYELAWFDLWSPWHPGLESFGVRSAASEAVATLGLHPEVADLRWHASALHIGLSHLTYCAVHHPEEMLEQVRVRTEDVMAR